MLTTFLLVIAIFIALLYNFKYQILLFLMIISLWITMKTMKQVKLYGIHTVFGAFKNKKVPPYQKLILLKFLKQYKGYRLVYPTEFFNSDYLIIDESGLYLLKILEYSGMILGNIEDDILTLRSGSATQIDNFFKTLIKEQKMFEEKFHQEVQVILVKKENCLIQTVVPKEMVITDLKYFHHRLQLLFEKKRYTKKEVDTLGHMFQIECK